MKFKKIGLAMAMSLGFATVSQAAVVFADDFNRTGALHGSTTSSGGLTWVASSHNQTTTADGGRTGGWNAGVDFAPSAGTLYLLTVTTTDAWSNNTVEVGFANHTGSFVGAFNLLQEDVTAMQTGRISGQADQNTFGSFESNTRDHTQYSLDAGMGPGNVNVLTLLLDTTSGLATSQLTWSVNGVQKGTWSADVTGYNQVIFGRGSTGPGDPNADNTVSNIQLVIIPEPSTALLGGFGMLCLLRRRRSA